MKHFHYVMFSSRKWNGIMIILLHFRGNHKTHWLDGEEPLRWCKLWQDPPHWIWLHAVVSNVWVCHWPLAAEEHRTRHGMCALFTWSVAHFFKNHSTVLFNQCFILGCFSLFRGSAVMDDNVMRTYTTVSTEPRHFVQYDQGEDRFVVQST